MSTDDKLFEDVSALASHLMPQGYNQWRDNIQQRIETAKMKAVVMVNSEMLKLYHSIGRDIIQKQEKEGWGKQVIEQLSKDLQKRFPEDRGYSVRNLKYMRQFAAAYPDFPFVQVPLAQLQNEEFWQAKLTKIADEEKVQVSLAQIPWYHHMMCKVIEQLPDVDV